MKAVKILVVVGILLLMGGLRAAPEDEIATDPVAAKAEALVKLAPRQQKDEIERLSVEDARSMRDYLIGKAIREDPSAGATFYLYEHLASIAAIDLAEKRLHKLLMVFVIVLGLFTGFFIYLLIAQNRLIKRLSQNQPSEGAIRSSPVYRGD